MVVYFFWGQGCPHCEHEKPFLEGLKTKYPSLIIKDYEVWHDVGNKEIYRKMSAAYGLTSGSVPATFIDIKSWIGYNDAKAKEIEETVEQCRQFSCLDPADLMSQAQSVGETTKPLMTLAMSSVAPQKTELPRKPQQEESTKETLPLLGVVDTAKISLPILTVVLAGLDGFNPCAFFVLLMLLSLMVHAQSRMKMLIVGGVFVFFSGFIYFLFMAAWLNLFMVTGRVAVITAIAGLIAVVMAAINIKDYFYFKQGVSLTISKKAQASLITKMRGLISSGSIGGLIVGTVVLAVMANMYELLCTAGFPMVFTRALTLQQLPAAQYYLYLVFYNVIYVIPLLVIVLVFSSTLGSRKLTEEEGRVLKLVSGLMMLGLGGLLVCRPALLNSIAVSIGLIIGVLLLAAFIIWCGRKRMKADAH
ncbi:MAG: thioredoxin family protein [Candidatus Omnitrophica bacterium]|nr:thioredoxin family protein [Candidatus Omnitrophota bacterium]